MMPIWTPARLRPSPCACTAQRPRRDLLVLLACTLAATDPGMAHAHGNPPMIVQPADTTFGRLFFTPEERRTLDQPPPPAPPPKAAMPASPPSAAPRRIDGFLRHSSGETTLWLDGVPGPLPASLHAAPFPALELIPMHAPHQRLRTGDSWQAASDTPPERPE
ncbi:hypothetical protein [Thauera butanivorans]|mgnify:CR=1 FL=1|uniref:hypothetical protein n=1 Tax=Thauera butanivorans TaxID=86174 RepID=UPI000B0E4AA0|nr:hypothetical protein [Thauera butanivorans]